MSLKKKSGRKTFSVVASSVAALSVLSSVAVFSLQNARKPSDNPWDYTLLTTGTDVSLTSSVEALTVNGDIRSNGHIALRGKSLDVSGKLVAAGEIRSEVTAEEVGNNRSSYAEMDAVNVFDQVYHVVADSDTYIETDRIEEQTYTAVQPIIAADTLEISALRSNPPDETEESGETLKYGVFGAGFLSKVYESQGKWNQVIPVFTGDNKLKPDASGKLDILELGRESAFVPVSSYDISSTWNHTDCLAADVFQKYFSADMVSGMISRSVSASEISGVCNEDPVQLRCGYDNKTINPVLAEDAAEIVAAEGNLTLNGEYSALEELRLDNLGGTQLIGDYPNLKYIYKTSWGNLNLAGNFPALEGVYLPGGQLLLGNGELGFSASNAEIVDENGMIVVYTGNDVTFTDCKVMTNENIVFRGAGKDAEFSKLSADNTLFAAGGAVSFEDMHDKQTGEFRNIPVYYSYAPMSFVNTDFDLLQGCFISANGAMALTESSVDKMRGYLLMPNGINESPVNAAVDVNIDTSSYNVSPDVASQKATQKSPMHLGHIDELSYAVFPEKLASDLCDISGFLAECRTVTNQDGKPEELFEIGNTSNAKGLLNLNTHLLAENDIQIQADTIRSDSDEKHIISSKNGDITISASDQMELNCIIYAPNGKVTIDGSGTINGRIFAREVEFTGESLSMTGGKDDIATLGFKEPKVMKRMAEGGSEKTESASDSTAAVSETPSAAAEEIMAVTSITVKSSTTNTEPSIETVSVTAAAESTAAAAGITASGTESTGSITETSASDRFNNAEYVYDNLGRLVKVIYDETHYVVYQYDANGNITRIEKNAE